MFLYSAPYSVLPWPPLGHLQRPAAGSAMNMCVAGALQGYACRKGREAGDLDAAAAAVGLERELLDQTWSTLSGGQARGGAPQPAAAPGVLLP